MQWVTLKFVTIQFKKPFFITFIVASSTKANFSNDDLKNFLILFKLFNIIQLLIKLINVDILFFKIPTLIPCEETMNHAKMLKLLNIICNLHNDLAPVRPTKMPII